jgi:glycerate kinase
VRLLVAPDAFKGTLAAAEVADALARGAERAGARADRCPLADGGEGTLDVLLAALGGERVDARAADPLGRPVAAGFALAADGATAVVETAAASGLGLVAPRQRDAEAASTRGTGELLAAAVAAGARRILLGAGGSATTDGGAGAIAALREAGGLRGAALVVLCDVTTPFERAAAVFAPQKGAGPQAVARLAARLDAQAAGLPRDPRGVAMTGAAGGLAGGLWAAFGAELVPGAAFVLEAVGFGARLAAADAVVTGEGRLDEQSLDGKLVGAVAAHARRAGVPVHGVVGVAALDAAALGLASLREAGDRATLEAAGHAIARGC